MARGLFSKVRHRFRAGERVECIRGQRKGARGIVVRGHDGRLRAGPDQVWVIFDGDDAPVRSRRGALAFIQQSG